MSKQQQNGTVVRDPNGDIAKQRNFEFDGQGRLEIDGPILLQTGKDQYQFNVPEHIAFTACILPAGKVVHNGRVLTDKEQRVLATMLLTRLEQAGGTEEHIQLFTDTLKERHPSGNWDVEGVSK
jgi:hypothetical protein